MEIPIPKTRPGVLASVILIIFFFVLYYWLGFSQLFKIYEGQFESATYNEGICKDIKVYVRIPKYVYPNGRQWIYVSIENNSGQEIKNVAVQFLVSDKEQHGTLLLLPSFFEENVFNDVISADTLQDGFSLTGRLRYLTRDEFKLEDTKLKITCAIKSDEVISGYKDPSSAIKIKSSNLGAFLHSVLENVLLPPWSNGLIPSLVILSCWIFEGYYVIKDEMKSNKDTAQEVESKISQNKIYSDAQQFISIFWKSGVLNIVIWFAFYLGVQDVFTFIAMCAFLIIILFARIQWLLP